MIHHIKGQLISKRPPELVIEANGVGYEITATMNTFYDLPEIGENVLIRTCFIVREDLQQLYGFRDEQERALFKTLIKMSGIGPKMALTILSSISPDHFVQAIQNKDTASLVRLPGVGKKTAERLVVEMIDRLSDWQVTSLPESSGSNHAAVQEAISALVALGYKSTEAKQAVDKISEQTNNSSHLIRLALQALAKK